MRNAFGILELVFVLIIMIAMFFIFRDPQYADLNPFESKKRVNTQKEMVDKKIQEIQDIKAKVNVIPSEEE